MKRILLSMGAGLLALSMPPLHTPVYAATGNADLEARLARVERLLEGRALVDIFNRLEALRKEVQELRGGLELQTHTMESIQRRQRDLYLDLDQRLQSLEGGGSGGGVAAGGDNAGGPESGSALQEREEYQKAVQTLRDGHYAVAMGAFRNFLDKYPDSRYAVKAQYWIGETYYVTRRFDKALPEFEKVVSGYPDSKKVADALLKIGFIHYDRKRWKDARANFEQVVQRFPDSAAAGLAGKRLQKMRRDGK